MNGTGPASGFWGGAVWAAFIGSLIYGVAGQPVACAIALSGSIIAAAIRECR